jgi:hypothetical protein
MAGTFWRRLWQRTSRLTPLAAFAAGLIALSSVMAAQSSTEPLVRGRRIAYQVTQMGWALHQTADRKECPNGVMPTQPVFMKQLAETRQMGPPTATWEFPDKFPDQILMPYLEASGPTAIGLNLDGSVGPEDYTSLEGEPGIDNQLHRVLACFERQRETNPVEYEPDSMYTVYYWGEEIEHVSKWKPLHRMADAYPDREGRNTAISGAIYVHLVQTFVLHPNTTDSRHDAAPPSDVARQRGL